jgi:subtilisin family serine protease
MAIVEALIEVEVVVQDAFEEFEVAGTSFDIGQSQIRRLLPDLEGMHFRPAAKPVPMFTRPDAAESVFVQSLSAFASPEPSADLASVSQVIPVQVDEFALARLRQTPGVRVWPSSPIIFFGSDCPPFRSAVDVPTIQSRLNVGPIWATGARGGGVVVAILDQGIDGTTYPVVGGYSRAGGQAPGMAAVTSHGSMAAADVLVAAPDVTLHDYPFLVQGSGSALVMMNAVLDQRRLDGTPHVVSNSWGYYNVPRQEERPEHEIWDIRHPLHRKIREVVQSGAIVVFAAGNCGTPCPSGDCHPSSIGPGRSIHGANSLAEVITVAAVNSNDERIGYSSEGPGMFEHEKPDVASYSHFFGNFGPGRPGGTAASPFDNGTSAACPVTAGVVALLLSAKPGLSPAVIRSAIVDGARGGSWNPETGHGIVDAWASYSLLP